MTVVPAFEGHVREWEIDANRHWSTVFYLRAFENAASRAAPDGTALQALHLRFFRELGSNAAFRIASDRLGPERAPYGRVHAMHDAVSGGLSAAAFEMRADTPPVAGGADAAGMAPRSLDPSPMAPAATDALLGAGRGVLSHASVLRPSDFGAGGVLTMEAVQGKVAEGNSHFWMASGLTPDAFYGRGLGRVNVELKLERLGAAEPGMAVRLVSWFGPAGAKTVQLCHQLEDLSTGRALAGVRAVLLIIDLDSRRPVALPGEIRALMG